MRKSSVAIFVFVAMSLFMGSLFAFDDFRDFSEGQWQYDATNTYFSSTANYPRGGGSSQPLIGGGSYKLLSSELGVRWSFLKNVSVYTILGVGYAQSQTTARTYTNSGLTGAIVGADALVFDLSGLKLIPDVRARFPLDNTASSPTTVETSESDTEFVGRMILRYDRTHWKSFASVGYDSRDGGRSSLVLYGLGTQLEFGHHQIGATFSGFSTGTPDNDANQPTVREFAPLAADGGSAIFNTVNPQQTTALLFYKYNLPMLTIEAGVGTTVTGSNSAAGMTGLLALQYRIGGAGDHYSNPYQEKKSDGALFHEDVRDDVNHDLFSPAKEEPTAPVVAPVPQPTPTPLRVRPKPAADPRLKIDNDLNNTEMQLELKSKKTDE